MYRASRSASQIHRLICRLLIACVTGIGWASVPSVLASRWQHSQNLRWLWTFWNFAKSCVLSCLSRFDNSGAPAGRQVEHHNYRNRTTCMHWNRNPCNSFFMVNMASGMDRGPVRPKTTSHSIAAILQLIPSPGLQRTSYIWHPCHGQLTPVKTRYPLTGITWPYHGFRFIAHRCHVFFKVDRWPLFSIGSRTHVRLICCNQGRVVRKSS